VLRAKTGDCSHSSAAYYFQLRCREAEKSLYIEGWKPNSQHIRLAVTYTVVIKNDATFPPHTTFQQYAFQSTRDPSSIAAIVLALRQRGGHF
jgi:hypothetical protein